MIISPIIGLYVWILHHHFVCKIVFYSVKFQITRFNSLLAVVCHIKWPQTDRPTDETKSNISLQSMWDNYYKSLLWSNSDYNPMYMYIRLKMIYMISLQYHWNKIKYGFDQYNLKNASSIIHKNCVSFAILKLKHP